MKRGFYESYKKEKEQSEQQVIVRNAGFLVAVMEFFKTLIIAVFYFCTMVLSSIGLTTLLNKPLRDLLFQIVQELIFGH